MKIYSPLESGLGNWIDGATPSSFEEAEIVLIPGGSDVNPELYGHTALPTTYVHRGADAREMDLINAAIEAGKFIVGICKGSQMLTARAGGWLIQDVSNHGGYHNIDTYDGKTLKVNSTHHQMSYPYDLPDEDYKLLGWSSGVSSRYTVQNNFEMLDADPPEFGEPVGMDENGKFKEPEVIWYPKIRGLAVQSHPEYSNMPAEFTAWLNELVLKLIKEK